MWEFRSALSLAHSLQIANLIPPPLYAKVYCPKIITNYRSINRKRPANTSC